VRDLLDEGGERIVGRGTRSVRGEMTTQVRGKCSKLGGSGVWFG